MFERVLYATDFSDYAQKITDCLGEIPGIKEIRMGSTAENVVRSIKRPVLVIKV